MNTEAIKNICAERLGKWQEKLVMEHATPVLLLGVGHDHKNGQTVVVTLESMSDEDMLLFVGRLHYDLLRKFINGEVNRAS